MDKYHNNIITTDELKDLLRYKFSASRLPYYDWNPSYSAGDLVVSYVVDSENTSWAYGTYIHFHMDHTGIIKSIMNHVDNSCNLSELIGVKIDLSTFEGRIVKFSRTEIAGRIKNSIYVEDAKESIIFPMAITHSSGRDEIIIKHSKQEIVTIFNQITKRFEKSIVRWSHIYDNLEIWGVNFDFGNFNVNVRLMLLIDYSIDVTIRGRTPISNNSNKKLLKVYMSNSIVAPVYILSLLEMIYLDKVPVLLKALHVVGISATDDRRNYEYKFVDTETVLATIYYQPSIYKRDTVSMPYTYLISLKKNTVNVVKSGRLAKRFLPIELKRMNSRLENIKGIKHIVNETNNNNNNFYGMTMVKLPKKMTLAKLVGDELEIFEHKTACNKSAC